MTDDTASNTKPTVPMRVTGALAGVVLGLFLTVSVLHFVKLGCIAAFGGELLICSFLTWVYIGWPVLAISALVGGTRGMLLRSRPEFIHWMRLVGWAVAGWVLGLFGQVALMIVVASADLTHGAAPRGLVVLEVGQAPPPVERRQRIAEGLLTTALALPALGVFAGTYVGRRRWKRTRLEEEETGRGGSSTDSMEPA